MDTATLRAHLLAPEPDGHGWDRALLREALADGETLAELHEADHTPTTSHDHEDGA